MFKKVEKVVFVTHPHVKGYATLADKNQESLVRNYMDSTYINSLEFEQLQAKMSKDNIIVQWKC